MALQAASRSEIIRHMREQLSFQLYNSTPDRGMATQIYMTEEGSPIEVSDLEMLTSELEFEMNQMVHPTSEEIGPGTKSRPTGLSSSSPNLSGTYHAPSGSMKKIAFKSVSAKESPRAVLLDPKQTLFGKHPVGKAAPQKSLLTSELPIGSAPQVPGVTIKPGQEMQSITVFYVAPGCGHLDPCRLSVPTDVEGGQLVEFALQWLATRMPSPSLDGVFEKRLGRSSSESMVLNLARKTKPGQKGARGGMISLLNEALGDQSAWQLLVATDAGDVDDGVPPVGRDQQILRLSYTFFVLRLTSPLRKVSSTYLNTSTSGGAIPTMNLGESGRDASSRILTKIHLDFLGVEKNQYVIIPCAADTLVSALVYNVIRVRALAGNPNDYTFQSMKGSAVNMDDRVGGLPESEQSEMKMVFKSTKAKRGTRRGFRASKSRSHTQQVSSLGPVKIGDNILFTKHTALARTEYRVTKINKKGKRQQRVLGIDREKLTNVAAGTNIIRKKAKKPHRLIKDVVSVRADEVPEGKKPEENCGFRIQFKDERRELVYEAQTPDEAREIIAKISYIVEHIESISARGGGESAEDIPKGLAS